MPIVISQQTTEMTEDQAKEMMEDGKDCKEVITQLSAVRSAVDRTIGVIVSTNLVQCVRQAEGDDGKVDEVIKEAVNLVVKSR